MTLRTVTPSSAILLKILYLYIVSKGKTLVLSTKYLISVSLLHTLTRRNFLLTNEPFNFKSIL